MAGPRRRQYNGKAYDPRRTAPPGAQYPMSVLYRGADLDLDQAPAEEGAEALAPVVRELLDRLGEDTTREGLVKTPHRVEAALRYLTQGYNQTVAEVVNGAVFHEPGQEMIIVKDIEFYSLCEHHMLPFFGKAHVGYISDDRIIGLSKIPRIVDLFARRLQLQERMSKEIASALQDALEPLGVGVILEAHHFCMMMRGVEKQESRTTTSCMLGQFREDDKTRSEFLQLIA